MDVGSSINPAIDIGQIEGAFVQGVGWSTTEELIWGDEEHEWIKPRGRLHTTGPGFYKPPGLFFTTQDSPFARSFANRLSPSTPSLPTPSPNQPQQRLMTWRLSLT